MRFLKRLKTKFMVYIYHPIWSLFHPDIILTDEEKESLARIIEEILEEIKTEEE